MSRQSTYAGALRPGTPGPGPTPTPWTRTQLRDFQGDLMVWCPAVKPTYTEQPNRDGVFQYDPELRLYRGTAHGIEAGWVWTLWIWRYPAAKRQTIYDAILADGNTHCVIQAGAANPDGGYHDLAPMTPAECAAYGGQVMTVHDELIARRIIPVWAGCAPATPGGPPETTLAPGMDPARCLVAMNDWDNSARAWAHVQYLARLFPHALIYYELPGPRTSYYGSFVYWPEASGGDEPVVPMPDNGGAWIRAAQQAFPNFVGVLHETDTPAAPDRNIAWLEACRAWWRDLQQVRFETDTYWKFWDNLDWATQKTYNDWLGARCPWLSGFMSGGTTHPAPPDPHEAGHYEGELQGDQVQIVNAPDFRGWAVTTSLEAVTVGLENLIVRFTKQAPESEGGWPTVSFGVQYSLGLCLRIGGQWYGCAPIELWQGKEGSGGPIQAQTVDGTPPGQIPRNWFYDGRWGPMHGYQPAPGELIGVFVVAGDARNNICPVMERSNIVLVRLPEPGVAVTFTP